MTVTAPNLGKFFTSCTKRPATAEDIALLSPGDWISERDTPWSWQFKNSCQDMAVGVWEGKEFFVPHHLLMVCEVIEGQVVEKFFKKPEAPDLKTDYVEFGIGDRVKWRDAPTAIYQILKLERGGHVMIELVESNTKPKPPRKKRVALWEIQFLAKRPAIGTDLGFKVGDRIISKHRLSLGQIFEIAEYPSVYADGLISYESLVTTTNLVLDFDQVSLVNEDSWNPADFGEVPHQVESSGQATIFYEANGGPPEPDDFKTVKEFEEAWQQWNLLQGTFSQEHPAIQKVQLPQDTDPSGQLTTTPTPVASTESDSQESCSLSKISVPLQTTLFSDSQYQISAYSQHLVQIFPWLVSELGLLEFADNCFLKDSDLFDSNAQAHLSLKMLTDSLAQTTELLSRKSSKRLQVWGIASPGNLGMVTGTSPKTENGFSSWAITAQIKATQQKPGKKSLAEIIGVGNAIVYRAPGGDRIYTEVSPTLRSLSNTGNHQSGSGAYKIREYQGESYLERPINATEAEQLMGWEVGSTAIGINIEGDEISISQTQRIKILGNGIVPGEITDILTAIKPMLERKLESEVPENMRFAYRQLRQKGMSYQDAICLLGD